MVEVADVVEVVDLGRCHGIRAKKTYTTLAKVLYHFAESTVPLRHFSGTTLGVAVTVFRSLLSHGLRWNIRN